MDKHGNLTGWRAAVAKACGNRDPIDAAGVDQVVAAYVRHHVEGATRSAVGARQPSVEFLVGRITSVAYRAAMHGFTEDVTKTIQSIAESMAEAPRSASGEPTHRECLKCGCQIAIWTQAELDEAHKRGLLLAEKLGWNKPTDSRSPDAEKNNDSLNGLSGPGIYKT